MKILAGILGSTSPLSFRPPMAPSAPGVQVYGTPVRPFPQVPVSIIGYCPGTVGSDTRRSEWARAGRHRLNRLVTVRAAVSSPFEPFADGGPIAGYTVW